MFITKKSKKYTDSKITVLFVMENFILTCHVDYLWKWRHVSLCVYVSSVETKRFWTDFNKSLYSDFWAKTLAEFVNGLNQSNSFKLAFVYKFQATICTEPLNAFKN